MHAGSSESMLKLQQDHEYISYYYLFCPDPSNKSGEEEILSNFFKLVYGFPKRPEYSSPLSYHLLQALCPVFLPTYV